LNVTSAIFLGLLSMTTFAFQIPGETFENVEYGEAGGTRLSLDAHIPDGKGPFPAAIIVHGGAWVSGDRTRSVRPLFQPLAGAGIATFSISYRLINRGSDGFRIPGNISQLLTLGTAVDDVRQAVSFVKLHAQEYRVDPGRIALIGESAGAQLASVAALRPGVRGEVRAVVAMYCPADLVKLAQTSAWIPDNIRELFKGSALEALLFAQLRELSPVSWVRKDAPPFLLIHGTADRLVPFDQSEELCDKLHDSGARCEIFPVGGGHHGMKWWESEGRTAYKEKMVRWLAQELRGPR
jgi:acetyl esterase/lipase